MRINSLFLLIGLIFLLNPLKASGLELATSNDKKLLLESGKEYHDLVISAAETIDLRSTIKEGALLAGKTVNIDGPITGNVIAGAQKVHVTSNIEGDLVVAALDLEIASNAKISGDLLFWGNSLTIEGIIDGNAKIFSDRAIIDGTINQGATFNTANLEISSQAVIGGPISGSISNSVSIPETIDFKDTLTLPQASSVATVSRSLVSNLSIALMFFLLTLFINWIAPKKTLELRQNIYANPLRSVLVGIIALLGIPAASMIVAAVIITLPISLLISLVFAITAILANIFSSLWLGDALSSGKLSLGRSYLLGALSWSIIGLFGAPGVILILISWLGGLGTIWYYIFDHRGKFKKP